MNQPLTITRGEGGYVLESCQLVAAPREQVFAFFADAFNLDKLTPPWIRFEIITPPPIEMSEGTLIDYRLRIRGMPIRWRSRIADWQPPCRFVDEQIKGPYRKWVHEHAFEADEDHTRIRDRVTYRPPGGAMLNRLLVTPDVKRIFRYRRVQLRSLFGEG